METNLLVNAQFASLLLLVKNLHKANDRCMFGAQSVMHFPTG